MPSAVCDGITTRYEIFGEGPPLLMLAPGGFNATIENWTSFGIYRRLELLGRLPSAYACIAFDKRESGSSGGRLEALTWEKYARQARGLLDHLGIESAHVIGGCIGCSIGVAFAAAHPERTRSVVLYSPAGGAAYRTKQVRRFSEHLAYVEQRGLAGVVELARSGAASFAQDPRVGPWASVLRAEPEFRQEYERADPAEYRELVGETAHALFDRETMPGANAASLTPLEMPALVVPGDDENHARSAALYLAEHLRSCELWDLPPAEQAANNAPARILDFLHNSDSPRSSAAI